MPGGDQRRHRRAGLSTETMKAENDSPILNTLPESSCGAWLACCQKLRETSQHHKAIHETATDQWERAYHLGAAVGLRDARLEVLSAAILKHSNGGN